jgi:hypothetical protein
VRQHAKNQQKHVAEIVDLQHIIAENAAIKFIGTNCSFMAAKYLK